MIRSKKPYYSLILSAVLLLQVVGITITFTPQNADATHIKLQTGPNGRGKFIAYTNNVEVKGTVAGYERGDIYIIPDSNYWNLLTSGNYKAPRQPHQVGHEWYRDNIAVNLPALGYSPQQQVPILKLERGGYCERIGSNECYFAQTDENGVEHAPIFKYENGTARIDENGNLDEVQPGDRIKIIGVYALDNAHSWWSNVCEETSTRWEGLPGSSRKICFNHAELHPYQPLSIVALESLKPGQPNVESHIVVAPIYQEFYSGTYPGNYPSGAACSSSSWVWLLIVIPKPQPCDFTTLVDSSLRADITQEFIIKAPPKPAECTSDVPCQMTLQESNRKKIGDADVVQKVRRDDGWAIIVRATAGESPYDPSIYQATWSVAWSVEANSTDNIDPDTSITRAESLTGSVISNSSSTQETSIRFTYSGTDRSGTGSAAVVGFECSLDGSAPSLCSENTKSYSQLSLGTHTFRVAAIDEAGNVDKTPATFTWTVREGRDIPRICIVRPWLPQCDPNQQSLTTQQTPVAPSEPAAIETDNQTAAEEQAARTENELVQESAELTPSQEQDVVEPLTVHIISNATRGIVPATFQFDANITGGTDPYTTRWNVDGDRTETDEERIVHTFDEVGMHNVTLTATDSNGETLSDSIEVQVLEPEEQEGALEEEGEEVEQLEGDEDTADGETDEDEDDEDTDT